MMVSAEPDARRREEARRLTTQSWWKGEGSELIVSILGA